MRIFFLTICTFFICEVNAQANKDEADIKASINVLFEAMRNNDSAKLVSAFADSAILQTIFENKDGTVKVRTEDIREFGSSVQHAFKGALDERAEFETIKIDGPLASVWTPYKFFYQGKFVHCGVNSFQMIRSSGTWKIQYLTDTRRKSPCK